ncbi:MAG: MFS transporter [Candidatus Neomarinimicrobiota bacterium]|nr:MFS transporter [Candidatus Neomarinimicrobiota bacterium]MCD6100385.1 MFS transporter [Candidatus Neomarinimicrobiota bacterium]RKY48439.1 MAG: MFS transporter [Candidatus Neomarinimicrobiota bacterium]
MQNKEKHKLGRNVISLGMVSLFTDLSSQMVYPLIPSFLSAMGVPPSYLGVIEGVAESTASLLRTVFGRLSDKLKKRKIFILFGYGLSAISRPFFYIASSWFTVLTIRFADRVGKAARTPARDALISASIHPSIKGKAFGFHRAMDRIGAILGPLLAMLILNLLSDSITELKALRITFLISVIPAFIALFFIRFAQEVRSETTIQSSIHKSGILSTPFILFLIANAFFTLGNSSNAFLILKAQEVGITTVFVPALWIVYNTVCTISSPILGSLSDKIGRKPIIGFSFIYYAFIYILFGFASKTWMMWVLFAAYGIFYGLSEGVFRAYIADIVEEENRATAYGLLNTIIGVFLLPASVLMGVVWTKFNSQIAFFMGAGFGIIGFLTYLVSLLTAHNIRKSE